MRKNPRILIAEDDEGQAFLLKKRLSRIYINRKIIHFINGNELLEYVKKLTVTNFKENPCLLLLDLRMPNMDGIEVLRNLAESKKLQYIKTIIITTSDNPEDIALCYSFGCSNYITKPVDFNKLSEVILQNE